MNVLDIINKLVNSEDFIIEEGDCFKCSIYYLLSKLKEEIVILAREGTPEYRDHPWINKFEDKPNNFQLDAASCLLLDFMLKKYGTFFKFFIRKGYISLWFAKQDLPLEQSIINENNKMVDEQIKNLQQSIPLAEKRIQRDLFYKELLNK